MFFKTPLHSLEESADSTPDAIHFNTDLASAGPVFITTTTQRVVTGCTGPPERGPSPRHAEAVKENIYLSLRSSHTLHPACIFKSAASFSLFSHSLHHSLRLSQPLRLYLFSFLSSFVLPFRSLLLD